MIYRLLADVILIVHAAIIVFVIGGLLATIVGALARWRWVTNRWFRLAHLVVIAFVVVQAWMGRLCPLTIWENELRVRSGGEAYPGSFFAYWVHQLVFYEAPMSVFMICYTVFGLAVLASFWWAPVRWRQRGA